MNILKNFKNPKKSIKIHKNSTNIQYIHKHYKKSLVFIKILMLELMMQMVEAGALKN